MERLGSSDRAQGSSVGVSAGKEWRAAMDQEVEKRLSSMKLLKLKMGQGVSTSAPTSPNIGTMDLTWDEDEARSVKRKRVGEEQAQQKSQELVSSEERMAKVLRKSIKEVDGEVRKLAEWTKERNTKKEIKEIASKLRSLMSIVLSNQNWELL